MRFMMLYKPGQDGGAPPSAETLQQLGELIEEGMRDGTLLATEGLRDSSRATRVRVSGGDFIVTDGPFSEAKEIIGGYAIMELDSHEDAIERTKRFLALMGGGETEIRQIDDRSDFDPTFSGELSEAAER